MHKIFSWSYSVAAAAVGGLAVIVTQSPAAENKLGGLDLIKGEILLDRLADGRDAEIADVARILLEHWKARRYIAEFKAPIRIDPEAGKRDDDRLEGEMKSLAEVGVARTSAAAQPQHQAEVSKCLGAFDMCVKDTAPRFNCIAVSAMCVATTLVPFVEGSK